MATTTTRDQELIWQGRLHIGDEPGVFRDAEYVGLCAEHPVTIVRLDPGAQQFQLVLLTSDAETYAGYPGHEISVFQYLPDPGRQFRAVQHVLAAERLAGVGLGAKEVSVRVGLDPGPFRLSVRLRVDTTVIPGRYDDFVWHGLALKTPNIEFVASFGFSPELSTDQ